MTHSHPRHIDLDIGAGAQVRFALLMTHYRSPCEIGQAKVKSAGKQLRRLAMACEPNLGPPPVAFIECLSNDMNTPGCIAMLHQYRAAKMGKELFASLRFLGFFGSNCLVDELKTHPPGSIFGSPEYVTLGQA